TPRQAAVEVEPDASDPVAGGRSQGQPEHQREDRPEEPVGGCTSDAPGPTEPDGPARPRPARGERRGPGGDPPRVAEGAVHAPFPAAPERYWRTVDGLGPVSDDDREERLGLVPEGVAGFGAGGGLQPGPGESDLPVR